jgi:hypothetical protein
MELLGDVGQVEACFGAFGDSVNLGTTKVHDLGGTYHRLISVSFEIVLISTKDRCMVCVEHAIGSKIVLGAPDGTRR